MNFQQLNNQTRIKTKQKQSLNQLGNKMKIIQNLAVWIKMESTHEALLQGKKKKKNQKPMRSLFSNSLCCSGFDTADGNLLHIVGLWTSSP